MSNSDVFNNQLNNKDDILLYLNQFADVNHSDDIILQCKEKIKQTLLGCPELLYALHDVELENQLFDINGNINIDGEWDKYFGIDIRPYLFFPEVHTASKNYISYKVEYQEVPRFNSIEQYMDITFVILIAEDDIIDIKTGLCRHDLLASIIRDHFNWSNIFGTQCKLLSNKEGLTDTRYLSRTLVFTSTIPNHIKKNNTIINNKVRV